MKSQKYFALIVLLYFITSFYPKLQAQDYQPFVQENKKWLYLRTTNEGGIWEEFISYSIGSDTIVDDKNYFKFYAYNYLIGIIREDSLKQVFYRRIDNEFYVFGCDANFAEKDTLIYDFSVGTGDTIVDSHFCDQAWEISKIDSIQVNDKHLKRYYVPNDFPSLIEAIGSLYGGFYVSYVNWEAVVQLVCVKDSQIYYKAIDSFGYYNTYYIDENCGVIVGINENEYQGNLLLDVFPNPSYGGQQLTISNLASNAQIKAIYLFDINGRRETVYWDREGEDSILCKLPAYLSGGIYFIQVNTSKGVQTSRLIIH